MAGTSQPVVSDLAFAPALTQAELVRRGEVTPLELVDLYLERIERLDPELNAFVTVDAEGARAAARAPRPGPFSGVPIAIKDLTETAGLRTTLSSKTFANNVPTRDAAVVRRIREAGFVILGKTNTPELGSIANTESELNGACRNPWDPTRTPGGSSGGAAAAVAAGLSPIAEASDGGGSIRIPSSCCGVFGIKPSRGRVSRAPYGYGVMGIATNGPIARTVADAVALLDVLAGYEPGDLYTAPPPARPFSSEVGVDPGRLRVAVTIQPPFDVPVDPACAGAARTFADLLTELGHDVKEVPSPYADPEAPRYFGRIWAVETGRLSCARRLPGADQPDARRARAPHDECGAAQAVVALEAFTRRVLAFWADYDVVVTPTLAQPPVPVGWAFAPEDPQEQFRQQFTFTPFTAVVNVTGQPAVAIPVTQHEGLPIGVQAIGRANDEVTLIRLAAQVEQARPSADRPPTDLVAVEGLRELGSSSVSSAVAARPSRAITSTVSSPASVPTTRSWSTPSSARAIAGAEPSSAWSTTTFCAATIRRPNCPRMLRASRVDPGDAARASAAARSEGVRARRGSSRGRALECLARSWPA